MEIAREQSGGTVSTVRLYGMRAVYLLNFALLGSDVWPALFGHQGDWETMRGVAFSFWAALSLLSGLGLRYPLQMSPILLLQFAYKLIWIAAVGLPVWTTGGSTPLDFAFLLGIVFDVIAIPWPYIVTNYIKATGDRWRSAKTSAL